jgi:DNA invertase Pin-like site-specific DNA recombinase
MNVLSKEKQQIVIGALADGNSIRAIERMSGIHRDTIMRPGVRVGERAKLFSTEKCAD